MLTIAKLLLTLTVLGYALVTIKADFNKTHATNPKWTPHARFHVVWQILSYSGVGLIALYLIWSDGPNPTERLYLAAAISAAIYGAFFAAVLTRPLFGGALYDDNGYRPFQPPMGPKTWRWDVNLTAFTVLPRFGARASSRCWRRKPGRRQRLLVSGTSMPSAVARSIWWSCSCIRILRICSAMANSPNASHCRMRSR